MKKHYVFNKMAFFLAVLLSVAVLGASAPAAAEEDVTKHPACPYCGMDRAKFAHSRVYVVYDDGTSVGTCSLHCAAIDMSLKIDKTPEAIMVGDYNSKKLVDAEKAYWVIGGSKMGVMTARAKWAFEKKEDADHFVTEFGGKSATLDQAFEAAFEDMYKDIQMIREKRKMMKMKKMKTQS